MVAESIVILAPIVQVGWRSASAGVTDSRSSAARPRKGPPDAVSTPATTRSRATPSISWKRAECSELTGTSAAPVRRRAAATRSPPATRLSLLARATGTPRSTAASVGRSPAAPTRPFRTMSGSLASISAARSGSYGTDPPPPAQAVCSTACAAAWARMSSEPAAAGEAAGDHVGGGPDHLQGLHADGPRGAEDEHADHASECSGGPARRPPARVKRRESPAGGA